MRLDALGDNRYGHHYHKLDHGWIIIMTIIVFGHIWMIMIETMIRNPNIKTQLWELRMIMTMTMMILTMFGVDPFSCCSDSLFSNITHSPECLTVELGQTYRHSRVASMASSGFVSSHGYLRSLAPPRCAVAHHGSSTNGQEIFTNCGCSWL